MFNDALFLGIDTSNYTTSAALIDKDGNIISDCRTLLTVKQGEKGLRQSDALFQHWKNLPEMLEPVLKEYGSRIVSVCSGSKPRPQEGSYMPVFTAGTAVGRIIASAIGAEYCEISHQESHLLSAAYNNGVDVEKDLILAHLSGGTLEFVKVSKGVHEIVFATKDISYGQLIDRTGVFLGFPFPSGKYIDGLALECGTIGVKNPISCVFTDETGLNISGLENSLKNAKKDYNDAQLCSFLMERISESLVKICEMLKEKYAVKTLLICGGVASSEYIRRYCSDRGYVFGEKKLCSDNAVGEACAARKLYLKDRKWL